jgi:hypothetical protein
MGFGPPSILFTGTYELDSVKFRDFPAIWMAIWYGLEINKKGGLETTWLRVTWIALCDSKNY